MSKSKSRPRGREASARRPPPVAPRPAPAALAAVPMRRAARVRVALAAMIGAYALVYGVISVVKFRYYLYSDFDLAIFAQATDQALRGSLYSSIRGMHWLGDHVSLILFVIAPLYAVLRHPLTLLLLQCATLALGALPVFAIARRRMGHDGVALACAALALLHPAIGYTNLFEFHPEVLATGTLLATFWAVDAGRFRAALLFAGLSLACREDVALVIGMLGLLTLRPGRPRRLGAALIGLAVASLILSFAVIRPAFASSAVEYGRMYDAWGGSIGQVALNVIRDPLRAIAEFVSTPDDPADTLLKRGYWLHMMAPLLFLPLLSPLTLAVALPVLGEHFLSSRPQQHWLLFQYTALVTPVMAVAAVEGLERLVRLASGTRDVASALGRPGQARTVALGAALAAVAAALVCQVLYGPLVRVGRLNVPVRPQPIWPTTYDRVRRVYRDQMVTRVPHEGGVVAAFEFLARLASRRNVHSIHHLYTGYYTFSTQRYPVPDGIEALLADVGDERLSIYVKPGTPDRLRDLVARNDLRPVDAAGDQLLFLRAASDTVELFRAAASEPAVARSVTYDRCLAFRGFSLPESTVAQGDLLALETCWRRVAPADRQFMMQLVVRDLSGRGVFAVARHLGYLLYPAARWPADTTMRETYRMVVPPSLLPGRYSLALRMAWWREGPASLSAPDDTTLVAQNLLVPLGSFTVTPARR